MSISIMAGIKTLFGNSNVVETATDFINTRWPPDMSEAQKAEIQLKLKEFDAQKQKDLHAMEMQALEIANQSTAEYNQRIKDMEGTAADLKGVPFFGTLIIFARGSQRPIWGYIVMIIDIMMFSKHWDVVLMTDQGFTPEGFLILFLNVMILAFQFGERCLKNVLPVILPVIKVVWGGKE